MTLLIIQSGDSNSFKAAVDSGARLYTRAITQSFEENAVENGDAYNLNTGNITFSSSGASGATYVKNNESTNLVITSFVYLFGNSGITGEDAEIDVIENPTGGTLLSSTTGTPRNRNAGLQSKTLDVDWRIGAEGKTISGGNDLIKSLFGSPLGRKVVVIKIALTKGSSIAIKYTPQSSITSQNVQIAMSVYRDVYN